MFKTTADIDRLRELLPPGTQVATILRHVSRSGMHRRISALVTFEGRPFELNGLIVRAGIGKRRGDAEGIVMGGCGMDMGFALVYGLSRSLYPNGFACIGNGDGKRCPSNDHANDYGVLAREYADDHADDDRVSASGSARSDYVAARQAWMATCEAALWSPERVHSDGGYALTQRWL